MVTLLINVLYKKWIEGIDVSYKQVPIFLNLGLNLKLILKDDKKIPCLIKMVSCTSIIKKKKKIFYSKQKKVVSITEM